MQNLASETTALKSPGKLGFGMMRLPKKGVRIDLDQTCEMVDAFLDAGFSYFDTAYVYRGSEAATKSALVDRHDREDYQLATKLFAMASPTAGAARKQLEKSLQRTGAGYFDYYLLHALMNLNVKRYDRFKIWEFVQEQKQKGILRHIGFSFHGGPDLLEQLLTDHPETEFVQLQLNYMDWDNPRIAARANYEVARRHNIPIVVMEPVKGGTLANPPAAVRDLLKKAKPDASCASWALRFAASLEGVHTVLSGMSNMEQMEDNLSFMKDFHPLNEDERKVIAEAQVILGRSQAIPCTACGYCTPGCPRNIAIPEVFKAANAQLSGGQIQEARRLFAAAEQSGGKISSCIRCGQCDRACPQHIEVMEELARWDHKLHSGEDYL